MSRSFQASWDVAVRSAAEIGSRGQFANQIDVAVRAGVVAEERALAEDHVPRLALDLERRPVGDPAEVRQPDEATGGCLRIDQAAHDRMDPIGANEEIARRLGCRPRTSRSRRPSDPDGGADQSPAELHADAALDRLVEQDAG